MKVITRRIWWNPVTAPDLAGYRVYATVGVFSYSDPFVEVPKTQTEILAPTGFPAGTFDADEIYNIYITAVDDVGNESDPLALSAPFDFVPPPSPTGGGISNT